LFLPHCLPSFMNPRLAHQAPKRVALLILVIFAVSWICSGQPNGAGSRVFAVSLGSLALFLAKAILILLGVLAACLAALFLCGGGLVARAVKGAIEKFDKNIIGVDIRIESLEVSLRRGLVDIRGLVVANAPGYSADYLVKVDRALADVNMLALLRSGFREIVVERIIFSNVDVIWEKSGLTHSNVKEIIEFLSARRAQDVEDPAGGSAEPPREVVSQQRTKSKRKLRLCTVKFQDIGVKMASHILHGAGVRLAVADVGYDDFAADHGSSLADDVAGILLLSILKTIVANVAGKSIGDKFF